VGLYAVVASKYRLFGGMYCLFLQHLAVWVCNIHVDLNHHFMENELCKLFMEYILLIDIIKCWLNTPWQVLRAAPPLQSLIVLKREDAARILGFLFHKPCYLRKLTLKDCGLGDDGRGLLENIVEFYQDLEALSLVDCRKITRACYAVIPQLKKLCELHLSDYEVDYMLNC